MYVKTGFCIYEFAIRVSCIFDINGNWFVIQTSNNQAVHIFCGPCNNKNLVTPVSKIKQSFQHHPELSMKIPQS